MQKHARSRHEETFLEMNGDQNSSRRDEPFYPRATVYLGLCLTCNHSLSCTFTRSPDSPVLFCEEFDISLPSNSADYEQIEVRTLAQVQDPYNRLPGLCSNCDNRKSCTLPKAEGGVWHCEEYL